MQVHLSRKATPPADAGPREGWAKVARAAKVEPGIAERHLLVVVLLEEAMHPQAVVRQVVEKAAVLTLGHAWYVSRLSHLALQQCTQFPTDIILANQERGILQVCP